MRALLVLAAFVPLVALYAPASTLHAQTLEASLRGRVVLLDSVTPAAGAVIEAVLTTDPAYRSRTVASASGAFTLRLARGGSWRVSAMRIGYFPTQLGTITIADREQRQAAQPFVISGAAVAATLTRLEVDTAQICGRGPEDSRLLVATLLAQARAALTATVESNADGAAEAEWTNYSIFTDRLGTPLTPMRLEPYSAATDRPYRSVSLDSLARFGYHWDLETETQFNAPDAPVLLSEQFVSSHCYRLEPSHPERAEWIGVTFTPVEQRRGYVDVRGTLWLERASAELRQLEFSYVGLPDILERATGRGLVEFLRLPNDVWVVSRWEMRLPRRGSMVSSIGESESERVEQINAIKISGGEVSLVRRGGETLLVNTVSPAERFPEITARVGMRPVCADAPKAERGESGMLYGTVTDTLGNPLRAGVRLTWVSLGRRQGYMQSRSVSASDGLFLFCNITIGRPLTLTAYMGYDPVAEPVRVVLRNPSPWQKLDVVVRCATGRERGAKCDAR